MNEVMTPSSRAGTSVREAALALVGAGKRYGGSWGVQDITLSFVAGTCTALLGENGAGKSTLIKMMSGLIEPSDGGLLINGETVRFRNPREARAAGVAVIPQELAYVPRLTVAENLAIGSWPTKAGFLSHRTLVARARSLMERYGFGMDVTLRMDQLPLAERQLVEIVKALAAKSSVLLLDEPTASLTSVEADRLISILNDLKKSGCAIVYVSHHLDECFRVAERIAVLRNGRLVLDDPCDPARANAVVAAMLGSEHTAPVKVHSTGKSSGDEVVVLSDWTSDSAPMLNGVSMNAAPREVVGLFGLIGSGVETVARALGGDQPRVRGSLEVAGSPRPMFKDAHEVQKARIGYVPAERKKDGLVLGRSIRENITVQVLPSVSRGGFVSRAAETDLARDWIARFAIRCQSPEQAVGELSGGNQQKVLLASRLAANPRLLVLHEPTRGVDIGARDQIHQTITDYARAGSAAIVITSDVDEAVAVADRLVVVRDGSVVGELTGTSLTAENALALATNAHDFDLENQS